MLSTSCLIYDKNFIQTHIITAKKNKPKTSSNQSVHRPNSKQKYEIPKIFVSANQSK